MFRDIAVAASGENFSFAGLVTSLLLGSGLVIGAANLEDLSFPPALPGEHSARHATVVRIAPAERALAASWPVPDSAALLEDDDIAEAPRPPLTLAPLPSAPPLAKAPPAAVPVTHVQPDTVDQATALFAVANYSLAAVRGGAPVPRVFLQAMPRDVAGVVTADGRREFFVRALLPALLAVNESILADRKHLLEIKEALDAGRALSAADSDWLVALYRKYKIKEGDLAVLLRAVDAVPPSLGLAQSIVESGWGTSAAARRGNAFFGQIGGDGTSTAVLARFPSMYDSVAAYVHNLNSHFAYAQFRDLRAKMRAEGKALDGMALATTLIRYSEMGQQYIAYVQGLMRMEKLGDFDRAVLAPRLERPAAIGRDG